MQTLGSGHAFNMGPDKTLALKVREKMSKALQAIADNPAQSLDSGGGLGGFDLWVTIDGKEWAVQVSMTHKYGG